MKWTNDRCGELDTMFRLLCEASALNRGSNVVGRIMECQQLAEQLMHTDLGSGRVSFHQFLKDLALDDRRDSSLSEGK